MFLRPEVSLASGGAVSSSALEVILSRGDDPAAPAGLSAVGFATGPSPEMSFA